MLPLRPLLLLALLPALAPARPPALLLEAGAALWTGWDSNPARQVDPESGVAAVRVRPFLRVETLRSRWADLVAVAEGDIWVPLADPDRLPTPRGSAADLEARLTLWPRGPVALTLHDHLQRTPDPADPALPGPSPLLTNRFGVDLTTRRLAAPVHAGLGYAVEVDRYDDPTGGDAIRHVASAHAGWHLAPGADLTVRASITRVTWEEPDPARLRDPQTPLRVELSADGYLARRFWGAARVGYADSLHETGPRFQHVVGEIATGWEPPGGHAALGVTRDVAPSVYGRWALTHATWFRGGFDLGERGRGRTVLTTGLRYAHLRFGPFLPTTPDLFTSHEARTGETITGHMSVEVDALPWLQVGARYATDVLLSAFRQQRVTVLAGSINTTLTEWRWTRHSLYATVTVTFPGVRAQDQRQY